MVLNFDDRGTVTHRAILGETCTVLEMAAGTWHAVLSLDTGGIIFEVKHGGYQPVAADDYAHWAPAEGEPGTTELMAWYAQAQVGDSGRRTRNHGAYGLVCASAGGRQRFCRLRR